MAKGNWVSKEREIHISGEMGYGIGQEWGVARGWVPPDRKLKENVEIIEPFTLE